MSEVDNENTIEEKIEEIEEKIEEIKITTYISRDLLDSMEAYKIRDFDGGVPAGLVMKNLKDDKFYWFQLMGMREKTYAIYSMTEEEVQIVEDDMELMLNPTSGMIKVPKKDLPHDESGEQKYVPDTYVCVVEHKYIPSEENRLTIASADKKLD